MVSLSPLTSSGVGFVNFLVSTFFLLLGLAVLDALGAAEGTLRFFLGSFEWTPSHSEISSLLCPGLYTRSSRATDLRFFTFTFAFLGSVFFGATVGGSVASSFVGDSMKVPAC